MESCEPLLIVNQGTIAPGTSIGTLTIGQNLQFVNNSALEIELAATSGTPGADWDLLDIDGDLDLSQATDVTVQLTSLDGSSNAGQLASFAPTTVSRSPSSTLTTTPDSVLPISSSTPVDSPTRSAVRSSCQSATAQPTACC